MVKFLIGLYERLVKGLRSVQYLQGDKENALAHEFSIGLIIRTLCLDSLIIYDLTNTVNGFGNKSLGDAANYETVLNFARRGLAAGLNYATSTAEKAFKEGLFENDEHYKRYIDSFVHNHRGYFEEYKERGKVPKLKYSPLDNGWHLTKRLLKTDFKFLSGLYFAYDVYSKYEHYGLLYYDVKHGKTIDKDKQFVGICEKFLYSNAMVGVLLSFNLTDQFLNTQNGINAGYLEKYMDKHHPVSEPATS